MARVVVGMSGGVDSAVAALLLRDAGHDVVGLFMSHGLPGVRASAKSCCSVDDAHDARRVADRLGVPFYALDFEEEFGRLIEHFVSSYARGETPNPCVRCNRELKFGRVFDYADAVGAEFVATGHYARVEDGALRRAADPAKDQSYMLFNVPRNRFWRVKLPLGGMSKSDVRRLAREAGLPVCDKPDSQGVCFIPDMDLKRFLSERLPPAPGDVRTTAGEVVGAHEGAHLYTIGQRHGLGVALGEPRYVTAVDPAARTVTLGTGEDLLARTARVGDVNWLADAALPARASVQVRYHAPAHEATLTPDGDGLRVDFDEPVRAPTPGQAAVFYDADRVLGGGWIRGRA